MAREPDLREAWQKALCRLERRGPIPSPWSILSLEVQRTYWDVLAFEHDGLAEPAALARDGFNRCVQQLRDAYDPHPELGPDAADEMTDRAIQQAQAEFAHDLQQHSRPRLFRSGPDIDDWRSRRGHSVVYF